MPPDQEGGQRGRGGRGGGFRNYGAPVSNRADPRLPQLVQTENKFVAIDKSKWDEEEKKQRSFKGILNKLTPENFDKLLDKILEEGIHEAQTLMGLIGQLFDKALTEPTFAELYATMCAALSDRFLSEGVEFKDPASPDPENPVVITFKRVLLSKCQEEFEKGDTAIKAAEKEALDAAEAKAKADAGEAPPPAEKEEGEAPAAPMTAAERDLAERRAEMEKLAMEKAKARADEELKRKAEEAAAAAARDKFKRSNEEYMARTAGEREAEAAAEGRRGKGGAAEYVDEDDDDVPAPDAELAKPKTAEEKAALKATGLFSDSEDEEEEAQDTDEEEEEAPDAEKSDAEKSDAESEEEEDAPAATEDPAPSGRRARAKPEAEVEKSSKAKKAMEALAAKSRKKRGLEPAAEGAAAEEEAADPEPEAPSRKRRKALVDDDDE